MDLEIALQKKFDNSQIITVWKTTIYETKEKRITTAIVRHSGDFKLQVEIHHVESDTTQRLPWFSVSEWEALIEGTGAQLVKMGLVKAGWATRQKLAPENREVNHYCKLLFRSAVTAISRGPFAAYLDLAEELNYLFGQTQFKGTQAVAFILEVLES